MTDGEPRRPPLGGVLETVMYFEDQDATERFYTEILGLRLIGKQPGRSLFFRAGPSVFLFFDPDETKKGSDLPPHGATGPGHVCFVVDEHDYESWKSYLARRRVDVVAEMEWGTRTSSGETTRSFYFNDPSGNLLEIANGDLWPR